VSLPSWPLVFEPQEATVPSLKSATECEPPAAIATTILVSGTPSPMTSTGVGESVVPLPTWPASLRPQAYTLPSLVSASVWPPPTASATTVLPASTPVLGTNTGSECAAVSEEPRPS